MSKITIHPLPNGSRVGVIIRDDDVCFFTFPYKLEQIYEKAWKQGFKVSTGIIPKVKAINDLLVPPSHRGKMSEHEFCENKDLVNYLKGKIKSNQCDVAQHGYNHEFKNGLPEFCTRDYLEIESKLFAGSKKIETCLPIRVTTFIPPWNRISRQAKKILAKNNYTLCLGKKRKNLLQLSRRPANPVEIYSSIDQWSNKEHTLILSKKFLDKVISDFETCVRRAGIFCIMNHYWTYYQDWRDDIAQEKLDYFHSIIDILNVGCVWKTTVSEVGNWLRALRNVRLHKKDNKFTLTSSVPICGVTIKAEGKNTIVPQNEDNSIVKVQENSTLIIFKNIAKDKSEIFYMR